MSAAESALAYRQAQQDYRASLAQAAATEQDPAEVSAEELLDAARAHLEASRDIEDVKAEYGELQAARYERGEEIDDARYRELADELAPLAEAAANLAGSLPGTGHVATAGIGD